jgi:hypothetical protein
MINVEKEQIDHIKKLRDSIIDNFTEYDVLIQHMDKIKDQFLTAWKQYEINKVSEQEFLETSTKFAKVLYFDGKKVEKFDQTHISLNSKLDDYWKIFDDLEEKS